MDLKFVPGFSLQQALDMIYNDSDEDNNVTDIYIAPPDSTALTDEDSADEDGGGMVDNLSGRQLSAPAEIRLADNTRIDSSKNSQDVAHTSAANTSEVNTKKNWINSDFLKVTDFPKPNYSEYVTKSPVELFELFIDENIMLHILDETRKYALFLNCQDPNISSDELKCFLGILILSGYNILPGKRRYWDSGNDMRNKMVMDAMRRDRFIQIMRFIHCADNMNVNDKDRMWKLRPLMDKLQTNYLKQFIPVEHLNFDESMVKYYGRHGCKQFIRGKPIRFGYKVWCLNAENGYLVNFEVYQGKNPFSNTDYEKRFGKASAPLVLMLDNLPQKNLRYQFYIDNLFTSFNLLVHLKTLGYGATGTMRANRVPRDCPLTNKKLMFKEERGNHVSTISKDDGIMVVRWMDNAVVTMASTTYGVQPSAAVKRYSQAQKRIIQVPRPHIIAMYNKYMGGTDRMDEDIARHRISIRGKKWYWPLFTWLIDTAVQNAWTLHKCSGGNLTNLEFRREIVQVYLCRYKNLPKGLGRPSSSKNSISQNRISDDIRYDRIDHLVTVVPEGKRRRCAGEGCSSVGRTQCNKCNVGLCIECFVIFHTK